MSKFDEIIEVIRRTARLRALDKLSQMETQSTVYGRTEMFGVQAKFSEVDKEKFAKDAEDQAVSRLVAILYDAALKD